MICLFRTAHVGICGKRCEPLKTRCDRHENRVEVPKRDLIGKYSGRSKFAKEVGLFTRK